MQLLNTSERFGLLTKLLHWTIFTLFVLQYFLVYRREYFPKDSPEKLQYILLHKSFGVLILILALFMIMFRHIGTRPYPINNISLEKWLAKSVHFLLYCAMLIMPLSGMGMTWYGGRTVSFFGWFDLAPLVAKNETLSNFSYQAHVWSSYVIIGIVSLHLLAALYHHFIVKDRVLKRML